jgi:RimJ/RimL family protein N-acetyltransferase
MTNNVSISSEQVPSIYLQSINESDVSKEYVEWLNDPMINQYLETRHHEQNMQTVFNFINEMQANPNEHLFTIRLKGSNKHIGNIKVGNINAHYKIADISLFIGDKNAWGKGIATQAIQLISRYSFELLSLRKLCAGAYKTNIASTMAFLKVGYIRDGVLLAHYMFNNEPCDLVQVCMFNKQIDQLPMVIFS